MVNQNTALLVIDVQLGFDDPKWGARNNPEAESNIAKILSWWRAHQMPIIHIQHASTISTSPLRKQTSGLAFKTVAQPMEGEVIFEKSVNSAFIGTGLEEYLRKQGIVDLVVVGLTTDHCISTTARMGANLGFSMTVVSDGTATFERRAMDGSQCSAENMHQYALASLQGEFAQIVDVGELLQAPALPPELSRIVTELTNNEFCCAGNFIY